METSTPSEASPPASHAPASSQRRLRLLVLVQKPEGISPGQRFRLEQWAPRLAQRHRVDLEFVPFESPRLTELLYQPGRTVEKAAWVLHDFVRRAAAVARGRDYDAVVVFREVALIGPALYERLLAALRIPIILDFDDAIWMEQNSVNGPFAKLHFHAKTGTICALSSAVVVGNDYLAAYAKQRSDAVFVVPTTIELERYPVLPEAPADGAFVVGWSGSLSTLAHLETARSVLEELARRRRVVVKVICNAPPAAPFAYAENVFVQWQQHGEAETLASIHAGIMPLPDDPFARGKCGLKALQFMATGRPVVVSPVGMNCDLIDSGRNGFLASSREEWLQALEALASSAELRAAMGRAGRETVEQGYSADIGAQMFASVVRGAVRR